MLVHTAAHSPSALRSYVPDHPKRGAKHAERLNSTCHASRAEPAATTSSGFKIRLKIVPSSSSQSNPSPGTLSPLSSAVSEDTATAASELRPSEHDWDSASTIAVSATLSSPTEPKHPASLSSISANSSEDHTQPSTSTWPAEVEARRQELLSDACVISLSDTGVQCALCRKWYKVGAEWKYLHIWRRHKRACPGKHQRIILSRPAHIPVEIVRHSLDEGAVSEFGLLADHRIRDSNFWEVQCDLCSRWISKDQWSAHTASDCKSRRKKPKGWVYLDDNTSADNSPDAILPVNSAAASSRLASESLSARNDSPDVETILSLAVAVPRPQILGSFDSTSLDVDEDTIDYAQLYSQYLSPGPSPQYSFRHTATPASAKCLRPASFESENSDDLGAAQRARDVSQLDADVLLEGTTRLFLRSRGRPKCSLPADDPQLALSVERSTFPDTVGLSVRQLMSAGLQPFTF